MLLVIEAIVACLDGGKKAVEVKVSRGFGLKWSQETRPLNDDELTHRRVAGRKCQANQPGSCNPNWGCNPCWAAGKEPSRRPSNGGAGGEAGEQISRTPDRRTAKTPAYFFPPPLRKNIVFRLDALRSPETSLTIERMRYLGCKQ